MSALTLLSDDESLFHASVLEFARREIAPHVREMDDAAHFVPGLLDKLFDLGVMGIEIPESLGGGGATFFHSVLAVEALARVDASVGVLVDVQNTLVINALARWGSDEITERYLPRLATGTVGAYALSEAGSGSDAFALHHARRRRRPDGFALTGRKLWITNANEADLFIVFATVDPEAGYKGITAFLVERGTPGFTVGKKEDKLGIRASSTCELLLEDVPRAARQRARRGRQGLQGRDRDAERRPHRHRRADARHRAGGARPRGAVHEGAQAVRQGDRRLPGRAVPAGARRDRGRSRAAARLQRRAAARRRPAVPDRSGDVQAVRVGGRRARGQPRGELFGGYGFVKDYPVEKLYRDAKIGQIYEGTSNLQLQTIAKQIF